MKSFRKFLARLPERVRRMRRKNKQEDENHNDNNAVGAVPDKNKVGKRGKEKKVNKKAEKKAGASLLEQLQYSEDVSGSQEDGYPGYHPTDGRPRVEVDQAHLKTKVQHLHEVIPLSDVSCTELMKIYEKEKITPEHLSLWASYGGAQMFHSKDAMKHPLQQITNYAETNDKAEKEGSKNKLRLVTSIMAKDDKIDRANILLLLASHGGVCNVQKQIGISLAYSAITNNLKVDQDKQSLEMSVLRVLYNLREICAEKVFLTTLNGGSLNSHPFQQFKNQLGDELGLEFVYDQHAYGDYTGKRVEYVAQFFSLYTVQEITRVIYNALNLHPRRLSYDAFVSWAKLNRAHQFPNVADGFAMLEHCIDMDTGLVSENAVVWMLVKMGVLKLQDGHKMQTFEEIMFPPFSDSSSSSSSEDGDAVLKQSDKAAGKAEAVEEKNKLKESRLLAMSQKAELSAEPWEERANDEIAVKLISMNAAKAVIQAMRNADDDDSSNSSRGDLDRKAMSQSAGIPFAHLKKSELPDWDEALWAHEEDEHDVRPPASLSKTWNG